MENYTEWNGYRRLDFMFEDKEAILVLPHTPRKDGKWLFKTEYFGAFPAFELAMLERGYHLAHVKNGTRWGAPEDTERQARFAAYLHREHGLAEGCLAVGMSCGGMQAILLAARFPATVCALYLDAPVLNLLSCPFGLGLPVDNRASYSAEFIAHRGISLSEMLSYREHPIDLSPCLVENKVPVMLTAGDADRDVPYPENGALLARLYRQSDAPITEIVIEGRPHHPHGLEDLSPLLAFTEKYYG